MPSRVEPVGNLRREDDWNRQVAEGCRSKGRVVRTSPAAATVPTPRATGRVGIGQSASAARPLAGGQGWWPER